MEASESESDRQEGEQATEFYDPDADEADAAWAARQRQGRATDAILSCPGCLATCCLECQQHELYPNQFRAMFVLNCRVDEGGAEVVPQPQAPGSRKRARGQQQPPPAPGAPPSARDVFHPVLCAVCGTRLGVRDADEVFHFTGVIASEA